MFDFDEDVLERSIPILVCWYPGGVSRENGLAHLASFLRSARDAGHETLVLGHPEHYGLVGLDCGHWPTYVDRLVLEIDREPSRTGRPLLLVGHGRGTAPALSLAARLGGRVLKVYLVAARAPVPGQLEGLSAAFAAATDHEVLTCLASLRPDDEALGEVVDAVDRGELKPAHSPLARELVAAVRRHYAQAACPDVERDLPTVATPIMAVGLRFDADFSRAAMKQWARWSSHSFEVRMVQASFPECLGGAEDASEGAGGLILSDMEKLLCGAASMDSESR